MASRRRAGLRACALLAVIGVLAGCGDRQPLSPLSPLSADRVVTMPGPAGERSAPVHHPASAGAGAPLVVVLHGADGKAADAQRYLGWDALANRDGFVVAYPDALDKRWNAGLCCRPPGAAHVDDIAFLHELREKLITEDQVDPGQVFAVGISNGGMLSFAWACNRPGDLAGIGVVVGALTVPCPAPEPLTVIAVHGSADTVLPLAGGQAAFDVAYPSLDDALMPFRAAASCPEQPVVEVAGKATVATWHCPGGHTVVRDVINGAGHGWPGASPGRAGTDSGPLDATGFIWLRLRAVSP